MTDRKITCEDAVRVLKEFRTNQTARTVADALKTDSRNVATALRAAVNDGRVKMSFPKSLGVAVYRFVRLTPRKVTT